MVKQASLQADIMRTFEAPKFTIDDVKVQTQIVTSPEQGQVEATVDAPGEAVPTCICLNLEDLKCFEVVERQYERWGVVFNNCIALQPSNPAFPVHSGITVLMGAPKGGFLEATFLRPVQMVTAVVTSSQRLVLAAYGSDRQLLGQTILAGSNLANSDSTIAPNTRLTIKAKDIHRVTFCAFDGQFTVDDFNFCF